MPSQAVLTPNQWPLALKFDDVLTPRVLRVCRGWHIIIFGLLLTLSYGHGWWLWWLDGIYNELHLGWDQESMKIFMVCHISKLMYANYTTNLHHLSHVTWVMSLIRLSVVILTLCSFPKPNQVALVQTTTVVNNSPKAIMYIICKCFFQHALFQKCNQLYITFYC